MDKRPRNRTGGLYEMCKLCNIEPDKCQGFCLAQVIEAEAEQETIRRKKDGSRI